MIIIQNIRYAFVFYIFSLLTFNRAELMKKSNGAYFPEEVCASILGNLILQKYISRTIWQG